MKDQTPSSQIESVRELLQSCKRLLFITGAGMSAESGLPTYRGTGGLYNDEETEDGYPIEMMLSGEMFKAKPASVWKYLLEIEEACRGAHPNEGHLKIAEIQSKFDIVVLTQNVDGLHTKAGSKRVIEIHGNMYDLKCTGCHYTTNTNDYSHLNLPPVCPKCDSMVRPDVTLFGEMLDTSKLSELHAESTFGFDMIFTIGTSAVFPYIVQPVLDAIRVGIPTVEINPVETDLSSRVLYKFTGKAGDILKELFQ